MEKQIGGNELQNMVSAMEAVLRLRLRAPMAMVADASSDEKEEHIKSTIDFLNEADMVPGIDLTDCEKSENRYHELVTKAFDCAVAKTCSDWVSRHFNDMPEAMLEVLKEEYGSDFPNIGKADCVDYFEDFITSKFVNRLSYDINYYYEENFKALQTVLDMGIKCVL